MSKVLFSAYNATIRLFYKFCGYEKRSLALWSFVTYSMLHKRYPQKSKLLPTGDSEHTVPRLM